MIYNFFVILIVVAALLMIGIVLIQESKGGGLASNFSCQMPSWAFVKQPTSSKRQHGDSPPQWWCSALSAPTPCLQQPQLRACSKTHPSPSNRPTRPTCRDLAPDRLRDRTTPKKLTAMRPKSPPQLRRLLLQRKHPPLPLLKSPLRKNKKSTGFFWKSQKNPVPLHPLSALWFIKSMMPQSKPF